MRMACHCGVSRPNFEVSRAVVVVDHDRRPQILKVRPALQSLSSDEQRAAYYFFASIPMSRLKTHDLDTPALLLDLPAMERNLRKMAQFISQGKTGLRPKLVRLASPAPRWSKRKCWCPTGSGTS
jgi:hypothetical protein